MDFSRSTGFDVCAKPRANDSLLGHPGLVRCLLTGLLATTASGFTRFDTFELAGLEIVAPVFELAQNTFSGHAVFQLARQEAGKGVLEGVRERRATCPEIGGQGGAGDDVHEWDVSLSSREVSARFAKKGKKPTGRSRQSVIRPSCCDNYRSRSRPQGRRRR